MGISTSAAAKVIGIHPNTLRWYEKAGRLPPIPRTPSGYRMYSPDLLNLARIISFCHRIVWIDGPIRRRTLDLMSRCRDKKFEEAHSLCRELLIFLDSEVKQAREALTVIDFWKEGKTNGDKEPLAFTETNIFLTMTEARKLLDLGPEQIRNWERNGLIMLPRNPLNGYRLLGSEDLDRLRVIRICRRAGYSLTSIRRLLTAVDRSPPRQPLDLTSVSENPSSSEKAFFNTFPSDTLLTALNKAISGSKEIEKILQTLLFNTRVVN